MEPNTSDTLRGLRIRTDTSISWARTRRNRSDEEADRRQLRHSNNDGESVIEGWILYMKAPIMKTPVLSGGLLLVATIAVPYVVSPDVTAQAPERTAQS